ncbi:MAG: LysE family translocator [Rubrivivax sp.]|nr:LysE family translocator [Rubrivivax sp.]
MTGSELAALLVFASAMAFTPGPNTTLSAALAANHGLRHALRFVCGVPVGWGLLLLACTLGLGAMVQAEPALRALLKWGGLAYLLWLAWRLATAPAVLAVGGAGAGAGAGAGTGGNRGFDVGFGKGVLLQFINVKAWMNALLISSGWITVADPVWPRLAVVLPLMMAYGLVSNLTYALVGAGLRGWLAQGTRLRAFNRVLAAVLLATAVWMAWL